MKRTTTFAIVILVLLSGTQLYAGDWPQFRCDAGRTAGSPEQLAAKLHLQWIRELGAPRPAFPLEVRLLFDGSYEPVVTGKTMFVPSMVNDSVTALDTETGAERWRFFAEGPVRFAPAVSQGKVYFVSDDGYLYCLSADDGELLWKFRGLPTGMADRKLLGHGRLISLRPARGGPVLADDVVYFAAGLWPADGVFVHALDAESGRVIWSNTDSDHIPEANMDHGIGQYAGITPQGYLAIVGGRLVVPCGAQLTAFLDLKTGQLQDYHTGWGGRVGLAKGTWFVAGLNNYLSHSGDLYDLSRENDERFANAGSRRDYKSQLYPGGFTRYEIDPVNQKDLGQFREPVLTADTIFTTEPEVGIVARDLVSAALVSTDPNEIPAHRKDDKYPDTMTGSFRRLWKLPSKLRVHIKAGPRLYVGAPGQVAAIGIPQDDQSPELVWSAEVEGTPHRMLAADDKLFVVTREGRIYVFGAEDKTEPVVHRSRSIPLKKGPWSLQAKNIIEATGVTEGYALVLGLENGGLVKQLLRQSQLYVIAVDDNAKRVDKLRRRLDEAGLYGSRVSIHVGDPLTYPLPPYMASLVASENPAGLISGPGRDVIKNLVHSLRPYGGTMCLPKSDYLIELLDRGKPEGFARRRARNLVMLSRRGPLPGSADWTHEEADAANAGASEDRFLKAPLGMLWFDGSMRWHRKPGGTVVRVAGGRVLVKAEKLTAIDVYTGRTLWQASLPFPHKPTDQMVTADEAIYVAGQRDCVVLDSQSGREIWRISLPAGLEGTWSNLHVWKSYLVARSGRHLFCVDVRTGKDLWRRGCGQGNALSIALGGGKVFGAETLNPRRPQPEGRTPRMMALDIKTGEPLWEAEGGSAIRYSQAHDLIVSSSGIHRAGDGTLAASLPAPPKAPEKGPAPPAPRPLSIIDHNILWGTVDRFALLDLLTGEASGEQTVWVRRGCTTLRSSANMVTTRFRANVACIDLESRKISSMWNVRPGCYNNLFPANGVLNAPCLTGGCTCNYTPASQAYVPVSVIERPK
ncbi:MAG: outer membrane protein assembly factor BamB family protein [Planctomycetota bacterium]|jgi:outer membrane protein assembly factor BamB